MICLTDKDLDSQSGSILFEVEAISKSNARLTFLKIPVSQYVIGHSFDTVFIIKNISGSASRKISFTIEVKMGEYSYPYEREIEVLPSSVMYVTAPIKWVILNHGICTFTFDIIDVGEELHDEKVIFVDKNGNPVRLGTIFHNIVTTTSEGVYTYWGMVLSAIGLSIIALGKILSIIEAVFSI